MEVALESAGVVVVPVAELKAYLRITTVDQDAVLGALIDAAAGQCERFTGQPPVVRDAQDIVPVGTKWTRLALAPVRAITAVMGIPAEGSEFALPAGAYAIDIDARGEGWIRIDSPGAAGRVRVSYSAGIAQEMGATPPELRAGILRLAAEDYLTREAGRTMRAGLPPTVTALWRPWRRMRLA